LTRAPTGIDEIPPQKSRQSSKKTATVFWGDWIAFVEALPHEKALRRGGRRAWIDLALFFRACLRACFIKKGFAPKRLN
ncbi:MAG: hypothetical protein K2L92_08730, partial [Muribaculaceae bacterium]|nr:hypothetical protein [Muribaculaceae bacterium]